MRKNYWQQSPWQRLTGDNLLNASRFFNWMQETWRTDTKIYAWARRMRGAYVAKEESHG